MTNYLEKFKNLQTEYPQCNLEIKTPNKNTKKSIIEGICNECSDKFEMQLIALGRHENIYCKLCIKNIKNSKTAKTLNPGKYEKIIKTLNNKYPKIKLKPKNNKNILELNVRDKVIGICSKENCSNTFEIGIRWIEEQNIYCKSCKLHFMQIAEFAEKNLKACFKTKIYILPSGKELSYQGYENYAIDRLINVENIDEKDILTSRVDVPECWYKDTEGVSRRYYIDIFIPSQNRCIEVKSPYTAQIAKDIINIKLEAIKTLNYKVDLWIFGPNGKLTNFNFI